MCGVASSRHSAGEQRGNVDAAELFVFRAAREIGALTASLGGLGLAPLQSRTDSEVISPTAMAGGNTGLVLCQVGGQYSGQ